MGWRDHPGMASRPSIAALSLGAPVSVRTAEYLGRLDSPIKATTAARATILSATYGGRCRDATRRGQPRTTLARLDVSPMRMKRSLKRGIALIITRLERKNIA